MNSFIRIITLYYFIQRSYVADTTSTGLEKTERGYTIDMDLMEFDPIESNSNNEKLILLSEILEEIHGGHGKSHKYKKLTKTLYPLFMGLLIAKAVLIPLILKMLTAVSTAALVMSKIALLTTGLLALKWLFFNSGVGDGKDYTHFELVYVPPKTDYAQPYRGLKLSNDRLWSSSNGNNNIYHKTYIPLSQTEAPYGGSSGGSYAFDKFSPNTVATNNLYRYTPQTNYNFSGSKSNSAGKGSSTTFNEGKPFL